MPAKNQTSVPVPNPNRVKYWHTSASWSRIAAWLLPATLLLFATFFFLGDIGFWADDYWLNQRHPITGQLPPLLEDGRLTTSTLIINRGFFLRPLFYTIAPPVISLLWNHAWLAHFILIVAHAGVTALLWRLMRRVGLATAPAAASALLFMLYPMQFENILWLSALPGTLAVLLMLTLLHAHLTVVTTQRAVLRAALLALLPVMAFAVCSLNEQPAAGVLAIPALYLAARPQAHTGFRRALMLGVIPMLLAGLGILCYLYLLRYGLPPHIQPTPPGIRGSSQTLISARDLPARIARVSTSIADTLWMRDFTRGAAIEGLRVLRSHPSAAIAWLLALAITGACWFRRWLRPAPTAAPAAQLAPHSTVPPHSHHSNPSPPRPLATSLLGLAIFISGFLPIVVVSAYVAAPRIMYWPMIGAAILLAAAATALGREVRRPALRRIAHRAAAAALVCVLLAWSVMYIGIQSSFRTRWQQDQSEAAQLRALIPDPDPGTTFMPLRLRSAAAHTGHRRFDHHLQPVWAWPWTAPRFIRSAYGRMDVRCGSWRPWVQSVLGANEDGLLYTLYLGPDHPHGTRIPWQEVIPFTTTPDGRVHIITEIIITEEGRPDTVISVPQARRHAELPTVNVVLGRE